MKITNFSMDTALNIGNSQQSKQGEVLPTTANAPGQSQVQLLLENQVKTMLGELVKILDQQTATVQKLPPEVASVVEQLLQQPLAGEEVIPQGLTAMLKGQKTVSQSLTALAGTLQDAAAGSEVLSSTVSPTMDNLIAQFTNQTTKLGPDLGKTILTLASQLADDPAPLTDVSALLQQVGRQVIDALPRDQFTVSRRDFQTKIPEFLNTLLDNFEQEITKLQLPLQTKQELVTSLQQTCQQLFQELSPAATPKGSLPQFISLPATLDDIIEHFEGQLVQLDTSLENGITVANLRQICRQLTQDLSTEDQAVLSRLTQHLDDTMPDKVKLAAANHNLPELKEAWVLQRLASGRQWLESAPDSLRQASQSLKNMTTIVPRSFEQPADFGSGKTTFNLAIPFYFGEEKKAYPAYIHVYQDQDTGSGKSAYEL